MHDDAHHLMPLFQANDVERTAMRIKALCVSGKIQKLQDEFGLVQEVVSYSQILNVFAACVHFHITVCVYIFLRHLAW